MRRFSLLATALLLFQALANPARAQETGSILVTAAVGLYAPMSDLVNVEGIQLAPDQTATLSFGQEPSPALAVRIGRYFTPKLALEVELVYANTLTTVSAPVRSGGRPPLEQTLNSRVLEGSVTAVYEVFRPPFTPLGVFVLGGVGLVNRSGDFYDEGGVFFSSLDSQTTPALVVGTGFRYGIGQRFGIRFDVRDYISMYSLDLPGQELDSSLQNDLLLSTGLEVLVN